MKKLISILLGLVLLLSLAACGAGNPAASTSPSPTPDASPSPSQEPVEASPSPTPEESPSPSPETGGTLVVYFSATGNTETAANYIAQITGADLFELEPADPHTTDDLNWRDDNSRVVAEYEDPSLRDVALVQNTVENWDSYDTEFIGYPIWWGIAAWPVNDFIQANDFSGKTVIPFCTSSSSGLGDSAQLLEDLAGSGDWLEGMRFQSSVSEADVQAWLDGLNLAS